jgi:hypothetical protein
MKKLINLVKAYLRKGQPLPHEHGPKSDYFQEKLKSMKIEIASDKSCCNDTKSSDKLEAIKTELKKPTPKPVDKKTETTVKPLNNKPVAKKPAPKKPKAE